VSKGKIKKPRFFVLGFFYSKELLRAGCYGAIDRASSYRIHHILAKNHKAEVIK
jgi:hypothetical protein